MAKKTLNKKIVDVIFGTSIFLVMYLIVGFLLGSSWLSKGLTFEESYELLKDGLSITATFLGPVAAFVLFSDWRVQHVEVKTEKEAELLVKNILDLNNEVESIDIDLRNSLNETKQLNHNNKIQEIRSGLLKLHTDMSISFGDEERTEGFINISSDLIYEMLNYLNLMSIVINSRRENKLSKGDEVRKFYQEKELMYLRKSFDRFKNFEDLFLKINEELRKLKV